MKPRATRWVVALSTALLSLSSCGAEETPPPEDGQGPGAPGGPTSEATLALAEGEACREGTYPPGLFVEASAELGVTFEHVAQFPPGHDRATDGVIDFAGAAIADLDGDSFLDVYLTNAAAADHVYLTGGRGAAKFEVHLRTLAPTHSNGVTLTDADGDGDRDALITTLEDPLWLENDGSGHFLAIREINTDTEYLQSWYTSSVGVAAGDMDLDGKLDLVVSNHLQFAVADHIAMPGRQWLMLGNGDGTWENRSDWLPEHRLGDWTFLTSVMDFDRDGDLDLYVINDTWSLAERGVDPSDTERIGSRLYRNDGVDADGQLQITDVTEGSGAGLDLSAMGVAVGDYDNDGLLDTYITSATIRPNVLLHNDGGMKFSDRTDEMDAQTLTKLRTAGWGTVFVDVDADGWQDLYVTHGFAPEKPGLTTNPTQENVLLHNNAGAIFQEHVGSGLADTGWSRSPVVGDLNRDGFDDLVVTNVAGPAHVFLNGCDGRPWLTVILVDHLPNRDAIGAEIAVEGGGVSQVRHIHAGSDGLYGSSAPEAYFGFPPSAMTTSVRVRWPDGTSSSFADVTLRRIATITRK